MGNSLHGVISLLQYLLPGFLAAWIFYSFTSYPKPSQFERVIQALIFTLITQVFVLVERAFLLFVGELFSICEWGNQVEIFYSTINAIIIGLVFSYFTNNDKFHKLLRNVGLTRETSYPSEWFGAFLNNVTYIVLHFKDERRLYGWPIEWPSEPKKGYFLLKQASWLENNEEKPIEGVDTILINTQDVKWVEFMSKTWENENGKEES